MCRPQGHTIHSKYVDISFKNLMVLPTAFKCYILKGSDLYTIQHIYMLSPAGDGHFSQNMWRVDTSVWTLQIKNIPPGGQATHAT